MVPGIFLRSNVRVEILFLLACFFVYQRNVCICLYIFVTFIIREGNALWAIPEIINVGRTLTFLKLCTLTENTKTIKFSRLKNDWYLESCTMRQKYTKYLLLPLELTTGQFPFSFLSFVEGGMGIKKRDINLGMGFLISCPEFPTIVSGMIER